MKFLEHRLNLSLELLRKWLHRLSTHLEIKTTWVWILLGAGLSLLPSFQRLHYTTGCVAVQLGAKKLRMGKNLGIEPGSFKTSNRATSSWLCRAQTKSRSFCFEQTKYLAVTEQVLFSTRTCRAILWSVFKLVVKRYYEISGGNYEILNNFCPFQQNSVGMSWATICGAIYDVAKAIKYLQGILMNCGEKR